MIRNYFKIVIRTIRKNKLGYFLNIFGLSLGIAAFIFIFYYVHYEWNYDDFHEKGDRIYRVALSHYSNGELAFESAENYPAVGPALQESFPEIQAYTRLYNAGSKNNVVFSRPEEANRQGYKTRGFLYADSAFFKIFSFPILEGDPRTCLSKSNTAVLSESFAEKVFKGEDPIGQFLVMSDDDFNKEVCEVTGIFKDVPANSHLKFDVLLSYSNLLNRGEGAMERYAQTWTAKDMYTYVLVNEGTNPEALEEKFPSLVDQHKPELVMLDEKDILSLQPLRSIHLQSHLADEAGRNGRIQNVYTLILVGLLILLIAMVNFLNYSVARSMTRAKDFGVRKIFGAVKKDMYLQFTFEAVFLNLLAIAGAIILVIVCFPYFKNLTDIEVGNMQTFFFQSTFFFAILAGIIAGILFGGILPAIILNRFDLIAVVKGRVLNFGSGLFLRRALITLQISASIALTVIYLLVISQVNFLTSYDLGIDITNTFVVDRPGMGAEDFRSQRDNFVLFKNKLSGQPGIESVSGSSLIPGKRIRWKIAIHKYGEDSKNARQANIAAVDENFLNTVELDLVAGRGFSLDKQVDADTNVILSVKAAKSLGFSNPEEVVGRTITVEDWEWNPVVIGVVEDYHQLSLRENSDPTVYMFTVNLAEYYMIKVKPEQTSAALAQIERTWNETFPGNPFQYYFLEEFFNRQYTSDQVFSRYMFVFAIISILISCIGLFNISLFTMVQRTKEIGVRKILGASRLQIGWLLIRDYLKLIILGSVLAFPLAYLFGKEWLANFVYSVSLNAWYFIISFMIIMTISIVTISFYTLRSTRINPVKALRIQN